MKPLLLWGLQYLVIQALTGQGDPKKSVVTGKAKDVQHKRGTK